MCDKALVDAGQVDRDSNRNFHDRDGRQHLVVALFLPAATTTILCVLHLRVFQSQIRAR